MLKAADSLHEAGHAVRMISTRQTPWATAADARVHATRGWQWQVVDYDRHTARGTWLWTGVRQRAARGAAACAPTRMPLGVAVAAYTRVHQELVRAILAEPQDLIYGGTTGAVAAVAEAGRRSDTPFGIDFEDFHCAEHDPISTDGALNNALGESVMTAAAAGARFVTAGSAAIADACRRTLGIDAIAVHNVFPLPASAPHLDAPSGQLLRAYWFGQTFGAERGLEDVVTALGAARIDAELAIRGLPQGDYAAVLSRHATACAPRVTLTFLEPGDPDTMVEACRPYDVGVIADRLAAGNRSLLLGNKTLTYPLAGLALAVPDTQGNAPLLAELGEHAIAFTTQALSVFAERLREWALDRERLRRAREAAWDAAVRRWHWEHHEERGRLLATVAAALS